MNNANEWAQTQERDWGQMVELYSITINISRAGGLLMAYLSLDLTFPQSALVCVTQSATLHPAFTIIDTLIGPVS